MRRNQHGYLAKVVANICPLRDGEVWSIRWRTYKPVHRATALHFAGILLQDKLLALAIKGLLPLRLWRLFQLLLSPAITADDADRTGDPLAPGAESSVDSPCRSRVILIS